MNKSFTELIDERSLNTSDLPSQRKRRGKAVIENVRPKKARRRSDAEVERLIGEGPSSTLTL